ncbi:chemotaxis protein CheB [Streptomyces formicae]|uniref:protein-glutamate methylesterase n=1 Tax=Streptomyces formicae TaxID=1616117 RepID=A0A291QCH9_9ACTN|nr:chemotaxis protein CheB [Streptomyces formicae]ATL29216.1 Chemotaxis response regulator protein-glutamate methylesterase CheB [Streptomyces formicae]
MTADQSPVPYAIVAVASSAGGIQALIALLAELGPDLPVPVLVVQHLDPRHRTVIADVLARRAELPVKLAQDGEYARNGVIHIAPPDRHLLVNSDGLLTLSDTELVHFVRPSADLLFESVAGAYGSRAIVCVLTGTGVDGAMGAEAVSSRGGTVIVQDPADAQYPGMPQAAIDAGAADFVLPLEEIAAVVRGLVEAKRQ